MTRYRVRQVAVEIIPPIQVNGRFDIEGNDNQRFEAQVCTANVGQTGGVTGFYFGGRWLADGDGRPGASFYSDDPNLVELKAILRGKALSATMANETGKVGRRSTRTTQTWSN